jgi:uncharacterized protein YdaT
MHDLVNFLVEERYCNTESEAIKIIESVSDEFYDYLIEAEISAITSTADARKRMDAEMKKVGKPGFNPNLVKHLRKKIAGLKGPASAELAQSKNKGIQKTPTGEGGSRAQKPRDVVSRVGTTAGIQRTDLGQYSRAATMATGISPESKGTRSVDTARTKTSELVGDRYSDKAVAGGAGTQQARSGGTRGVRTR